MSPQELQTNWAEFYEQLYEGYQEAIFDAKSIGNHILDRPLEHDKVERAISHLKNNKAPGSDSITSEDLKFLNEIDSSIIFHLLLSFWTDEKVPTDLKSTILRPLLKDPDGDIHDPANYRPISLLNVIFKLYEGILHERLLGFGGEAIQTASRIPERNVYHGPDLCS